MDSITIFSTLKCQSWHTYACRVFIVSPGLHFLVCSFLRASLTSKEDRCGCMARETSLSHEPAYDQLCSKPFLSKPPFDDHDVALQSIIAQLHMQHQLAQARPCIHLSNIPVLNRLPVVRKHGRGRRDFWVTHAQYQPRGFRGSKLS